VGQRQQPLQLRRIEADQIEIEALVVQQSQSLLNQGTRNNPLVIRVGNCVVPTVGSAEPAVPRKSARPLLDPMYKKTCGNNPSAKKTSRTGTALLENR
jgi:hypothetical protein